MAEILVVEDEPVVLNLLSDILRIDSHEVRAFLSPTLALEHLHASTSPVHLLITDVHLKPISGTKFAARLREEQYQFPIIFMTGDLGIAQGLEYAYGQYSVLLKPFTVTELRECVSAALISCAKAASGEPGAGGPTIG